MFLHRRKSKIVTDTHRIDEVLSRGVVEVLPTKGALRKLLLSGKRIKLYQGFDPTGTQLHIGHMVGLRKLAQFQELGHEVIFLIGDGTGQAGDPGGKLKSRDIFFTTDELRKNAKEYIIQASKVVSFKGDNPIQVLFNSDWLNKLTLTDILGIAEHLTLRDLAERNTFKERAKRGESVSLREFLYPLLQGYDSVEMNVDLEIGATDQMFNMMTGRTLVKKMLNKEKFVLITPLLTDARGIKIGKTEGNVIGLTDEPKDLYGKIMSLGDDVIVKGFEYLTDVSMDEVRNIEQAIVAGNPKQYKERLAFEIVKELHDENLAKSAAVAFTQTFSEGRIPDNIIEISQVKNIRVTLVANKVVSSNSEYRRLIDSGAIKNLDTGEIITDADAKVSKPTRIKIGKKKFREVRP